MLRTIVIILFSLVILIGFSASFVDAIYGGGENFPDRDVVASKAIKPADALVKVADLPYPPGNIAVAPSGDIFFTFHPEGRPQYNLAELVNGEAQPMRLSLPQGITITSVLSLRIDQQNRLWLLDYADHGSAKPQLLAFDLDSRELVHHHEFNSDIAPLGSHLNDFQVDAAGQKIYIADASILGLSPALVVYDIASQRARRLLDDHDSVEADNFIPVVDSGIGLGPEKMLIFGVFAVRPGVDSIALDRRGEWLYFAPVTDEHIHRVRVSDLNDAALSEDELAQRVEQFAEKTMSDGITIDNEGRLYLSDLEHSAIVRMGTRGEKQGHMELLYRDDRLRWPDGFSFGPDSDLYVTASALHYVIAKPDRYIAANGPYQIFKLSTEATATAGH